MADLRAAGAPPIDVDAEDTEAVAVDAGGAAPIDVDASDESDAESAEDEWYGARTHVQLRVSERKFAAGVICLAPQDEAWFNARVDDHVDDLEGALAGVVALQSPPAKDGEKRSSARVEGRLLEGTLHMQAAPAPYLFLVQGDAGYRQLAYCGYRVECRVAPRERPTPGVMI